MSPLTLPGRHDRSDLPWRKLRNHKITTALEACSAPRAPCSPLAHVRCFRPSRHSLVTSGKRVKKKKSGKNECAEERRDSASLVRGDTLSPGHGQEEGASRGSLQP